MGITAVKKARSPHQPTGQWITAKKRLAIYLRDSMTCVYCLTELHSADPRDITLDHLVCKVDGGTNAETNLITACRSCNSSRADKPLNRFASVECRKQIKRNTARKLTKYLKLATALISGETGFESTFKAL
jgi:5-methylcytosine-specific restriction endonuclease McrA